MVAVNIVSAKGFLNGTGVANYLSSEKIIDIYHQTLLLFT
jgi:hypothetical protein